MTSPSPRAIQPVPADLKLPISASNLSKCYGDFTALNQLSLKVSGQEILGLLGPNGAGKSTFIRLLLGAIRPSSGQASIYGLDCYGDRESVHEKVSYLPGDARLYRRMRGREVIDFFASLRGQKNAGRSTELAKRLDLDLSRRVAAMSTGMRQKLA
ncbi:MAG: ABC transporter ATP-binding protein, partial [Planctomycetota bacterium]|nr:ABC transporter ATP-binding protein [Planctomycetota bacterium]